MSRLADILKEEYKTKGVVSGLSSAMGKRSLEKLDIRNALFGGSGIGSAIGQKVFGKGYKAVRKKNAPSAEGSSSDLAGASSAVLEEISISSKISAKNSLALPAMARDMHLVKQNIIKLVKIQGGTPSTKAGDWFGRQQARETAFEAKFGKTTPTKENAAAAPGEDNGIIGGAFKSGIGSLLASVFKGIAVSGIILAVGEALKDPEVRKSIEKVLQSLFKAVSDMLSLKLTEFKTPFGNIDVTLGGAIAMVVGGLAAFNAAITAATIRLATLGGGGLPGGVPGGPGGKGKPGAPGKPGVKGPGMWGWVLMGGAWLWMNSQTGEQAPAPANAPPVPNGGGTETTPNQTGPNPTTPAPQSQAPSMSTGQKVMTGAVAGYAGYQGYQAVKSLSPLMSATKDVALDIRTQSVGQLAKSTATSRWGKFLVFVAKKSPALWGKIGLKLAQAGTLAAIPFAGWIGAAVQLGFAAWTAWDLYVLWREFSNSPEESETTTPTAEPAQAAPNAAAVANSTGGKGPTVAAANGQDPSNPLNQTSPSSVPTGPSAPASTGSMQGKTWNQLSTDEQNRLMMNQAIAEGWNKPTSIQHSYNNPGNITAPGGKVAAEQAKFGASIGGVHNGLTFLKFPTMQQGWDAMRDLWSRKYANKPLDQALAQWSNAGKDQANYNAVAMGGQGGSPTMVAGANNNQNMSGQALTQANAAATQTAAANQQQKMPEIKIDFAELGKALASKNMGGFTMAATPYDRDFYSGVTKSAAL